jgi:hypothetical protein
MTILCSAIPKLHVIKLTQRLQFFYKPERKSFTLPSKHQWSGWMLRLNIRFEGWTGDDITRTPSSRLVMQRLLGTMMRCGYHQQWIIFVLVNAHQMSNACQKTSYSSRKLQLTWTCQKNWLQKISPSCGMPKNHIPIDFFSFDRSYSSLKI